MSRGGIKGGKYKVLDKRQVEKIHQTALKIIKDIGIKVESDEFLDILDKIGAQVDVEESKVTISPQLVAKFLESAPSKIILYDRDDRYNLDLSDHHVYLGTGGAAINIIDLNSGHLRSPKLKDQARLAKLAENLENIHFFQNPVVPKDIPEESLSLNSFYAALSGTYKNVQESATNPQAARDIIQMASMIAGSKEKLLQKPFISFVASWMVSPLKLDIGTTKVLREITRNRIPVALSSAPVAGSTAPATLAGLLSQVHAEELFGIVLSQVFNEGAPVLYGPVPGAANMQDMSYLGGACETGLMNAACVQLARWIDIPIYSDAGLTESKIPDIQAGIEKAFNILQVALAGGNYIHHAAGMLESMLTISYEQFVIDNDIIGMALRALEDIKVDEDRLALEVINKAGPGGNFLTQPHTVKYARSDEYFVPRTADRKERSAWEKAGGKDGRERAKELAKKILKKPTENLIPEEADQRIREKFDIHLPREIG